MIYIYKTTITHNIFGRSVNNRMEVTNMEHMACPQWLIVSNVNLGPDCYCGSSILHLMVIAATTIIQAINKDLLDGFLNLHVIDGTIGHHLQSLSLV